MWLVVIKDDTRTTLRRVSELCCCVLKGTSKNFELMTLPTVLNSTPRNIQKIRDSSLTVHGAKLFNCLPKDLRNSTNCCVLEFKSKLDRFLSGIQMNHVSLGTLTNAVQSQIA